MSAESTFKPVFTITNSITAGLTRIERTRGFLEGASLSENWLQENELRALILEAHHTTRIEGTRLALDQAEQLLEGKPVPRADPDDARELLNYKRAFEFVSEYLQHGGPITEGLVREIHKRLVDGVRGGAAAPGEYRKTQNYVVDAATGETVYTPPPAHDVPIMMGELVNWLNSEKDVHPVLSQRAKPTAWSTAWGRWSNVCDRFATVFATSLRHRTPSRRPGDLPFFSRPRMIH